MEKLLYIWMEDLIQKRTPQAKARSLFQTLKEHAGEDYSQRICSKYWLVQEIQEKIPIS